MVIHFAAIRRTLGLAVHDDVAVRNERCGLRARQFARLCYKQIEPFARSFRNDELAGRG
jgi:hypothetical protein